MNPRVLDRVRAVSAAAIVFAALVRVVSAHSRFPWWEIDPSRQYVPETTLLPSHALILDALVWAASLVGVGACVLRGERLRWGTGLLALIGATGAMFHGTVQVRAGSGPDDAVLGSAWAAATIGAWAMTHLARDGGIRRAVFAVVAGAAWVLAVKGVYQVFVEHPATVAHYKGNTVEMLAAQGLEPGSGAAREFERRLMQPEATGWVGMSNAHASMLAALLAVNLALAWSAWRGVREKRVQSGIAGVFSLGAIAALVGLAMTFSKGGMATGLLALALTVFAMRWAPRTPRWPTVIAMALPALALLAVALRGVIGERLGELSLLFRSQYLVGAGRIIADSFPIGVGPGGFKAAYAVHKPPLSPESIESPHSVFFDWAACLGAFGAAWCALLLVWLTRAARVVVARNPADHTHDDQSPPPHRLWPLLPVAACAVAWTREAPTVAPDEWPVRLVALLAWSATVGFAARLDHPHAFRAGLFAAAVALVTHAQIEMTPILPATACLALLIVSLAAAGAGTTRETPPGHGRRWFQLALLALCLAGPIGWCVWRAASYSRWETKLHEAARIAAPLAELRSALARWKSDPAASSELADFLSASLGGRAVPSDPGALISAYVEAAESIADRAGLTLQHAAHVRGPFATPSRPHESALRLRVGVALEAAALGQMDAARRQVAAAERAIQEVLSDRFGPSAGTRPTRGPFFAAAASAYQAAATIEPGPKWLQLAADHWEVVAKLDPTALTPALRLVDLYEALGRAPEAARTARRALELDDNLRLDPLKQMSPPTRARMERLARGAE